MTAPPRNPTELVEALTHARQLLTRIAPDITRTWTTLTRHAGTGYPSSSRPGAGSRGGDTSDPTYAAAMQPDHAHRTRTDLARHLARAVDALTDIAAICDRVCAPPPAGLTTLGDEAWCTNCRHHGHQTLRGDPATGCKTLCSWCHDWRRRHGHLPDAQILHARHHLGRTRFTTTEIDQAARRASGRRVVV